MKKLLVVLAIGAFAACNNASETATEPKADSLTPATEQPAAPAPVTPDTTTVKADTTAAKADTTKK